MRLIALLIISSALIGCNTTEKREITVPTLEAGFYASALDQINDELKSDPSNTKLIEQKLYYCDQLNWPTECITALDQYKSKFGMTNRLVEQYITYYENHGRYQLLLDVMNRWNQEFDLKERYSKPLIVSLVKLREVNQAKSALRNYLIDHQSATDLAFASRQYLELKDTIMATYTLSRLEKIDQQNELMYEYGLLLTELGFTEKGFELLNKMFNEDDEQRRVQVARLYERNVNYHGARQMVKPLAKKDTIAYLISHWYKQELLWDSAIMYLDSVIVRDSTNSKAWWKKGRAYEDRGWLSFSLQYFRKMIEMDSMDTLARNRINLIQRKIAYLQRQKFEESKVPILELEPIKINN